jgi:hypothetical protein
MNRKTCDGGKRIGSRDCFVERSGMTRLDIRMSSRGVPDLGVGSVTCCEGSSSAWRLIINGSGLQSMEFPAWFSFKRAFGFVVVGKPTDSEKKGSRGDA